MHARQVVFIELHAQLLFHHLFCVEQAGFQLVPQLRQALNL